LVAVKIAHQADAERDAVEIIAVDMTAINLASPPVAHFDLAIASRGAVTNDKVIGEAIRHPPHVPVIIIEHGGVALARAAVMHSNELPAAAYDRGAIDRGTDRAR